MKIKDYYLNEFPADELGEEINGEATFLGLLDQLHSGKDVYEYIGAYDSLVRERLFGHLADLLGKPYEYIYLLWINNN